MYHELLAPRRPRAQPVSGPVFIVEIPLPRLERSFSGRKVFDYPSKSALFLHQRWYASFATVLFAGKVFFTALKALALQSKKKKIRRILAVPFFVVESAVGIALSILLLVKLAEAARQIENVGKRVLGPAAMLLAVMIFGTELLSVASEGASVWSKVCERRTVLSPFQRWRAVLNWMASTMSIGVSVFVFVWYYRPSSGLFPRPPNVWSLHYARTASIVVTVLLLLPSPVLWNKRCLRMAAAAFIFIVGALTSTILSFKNFKPVTATKPNTVEPVPLLCLAAVGGMSSVVFCGLPDIADSGLHLAHVRALKMAAFGVAPSAVIGFLGDGLTGRNW